MSIWNWFSKRKNRIEFYIDGDVVKVDYHCGNTPKDIDNFGKMLFLVNNGDMYIQTLAEMQKTMDIATINNVHAHVAQLIEIDDQDGLYDEEDDDEESIINPLDVFGGQHDDQAE